MTSDTTTIALTAKEIKSLCYLYDYLCEYLDTESMSETERDRLESADRILYKLWEQTEGTVKKKA